jgi:protein-S-isoprenylcysteine O-methyltransferase Ste14
MKTVIKQLISFILPVTVLILVPQSIEKHFEIKSTSTFLTGLAVITIGLGVMIVTISSFVRTGKGTLAPWSPTKKLIVSGMYGHVRNPMIMGVLTVLLGESIAFLSLKILNWALVFFIINNIYFLVYEEPDLEDRFGDEYRFYKKNVPRWIPRSKPFKPNSLH